MADDPAADDLTITDPVSEGKPRAPTAYEIELRKEAHKRRLENQAIEAKFADERKAWEAEKAKIATDAEAAASERVLRAELKSEALKNGLADLEFLKLIDLKKIKLDENGEIKDADKFFEKLKADKPAWFVDKSSTSSTAKKPDPDKDEKLDAMKLDEKAYAAEKARLFGA